MSQEWWPASSWAALGADLLAGQGWWFCPSAEHCECGHIWSARSRSGLCCRGDVDELEQVQCRATAMTEVSAMGREVERDGVFSLEKKRLGRILTFVCEYGRERERGGRQTDLPQYWPERTRGNEHAEKQNPIWTSEKNFLFLWGWSNTRTVCGSHIFTDTKNPAEHHPEEPAVAVLALSTRFGVDVLEGSSQTQPFCGFVKSVMQILQRAGTTPLCVPSPYTSSEVEVIKLKNYLNLVLPPSAVLYFSNRKHWKGCYGKKPFFSASWVHHCLVCWGWPS